MAGLIHQNNVNSCFILNTFAFTLRTCLKHVKNKSRFNHFGWPCIENIVWKYTSIRIHKRCHKVLFCFRRYWGFWKYQNKSVFEKRELNIPLSKHVNEIKRWLFCRMGWLYPREEQYYLHIKTRFKSKG